MSDFTTNAINLKSYALSESDKIIVMYSKEKGLIKGVAKGVRKTKNKLGGRMDLLVANKLILYKGKNLDTIRDAQSLNSFKNIRKDINKIFYSSYCAEVIVNFGMENDPHSEEIYNIFYCALKKIADAKNDIEILLSVLRFQLKIMQASGFALELCVCIFCNEPVNEEYARFSISQGGIVCDNCHKDSKTSTRLHTKLRTFLNAILQADFDTKTKYDELVNEKVCEFCLKLMKKYLEHYSPGKAGF